jgi:hypothetical protein
MAAADQDDLFNQFDWGAVATHLVQQQQNNPPPPVNLPPQHLQVRPKKNPSTKMKGGGNPTAQEIAAYQKANYPSMHYDGSLVPPETNPIKSKEDVTNVKIGTRPALLAVEPQPERVARPADMTRQIPRRNSNVPLNYESPMRVASIKHNVQHVPLRTPAIVRGVNALSNSQAGVIRQEAEFFGKQKTISAVRDSLNHDPLDYYKRDMMRMQKAEASDSVEMQSDVLSSSVRRTRTRKPIAKGNQEF